MKLQAELYEMIRARDEQQPVSVIADGQERRRTRN